MWVPYVAGYATYSDGVCLMTSPEDDEAMTSQTPLTLTLACSLRHMVWLVRVYHGQGAGADGACTHTAQDCTMDAPAGLQAAAHACVGRQACNVTVPSAERRRDVMPKCGQRSSYVRAAYHCIPGK